MCQSQPIFGINVYQSACLLCSRSSATRFQWRQVEWSNADHWAVAHLYIGQSCPQMCNGHGRCVEGICKYVLCVLLGSSLKQYVTFVQFRVEKLENVSRVRVSCLMCSCLMCSCLMCSCLMSHVFVSYVLCSYLMSHVFVSHVFVSHVFVSHVFMSHVSCVFVSHVSCVRVSCVRV